MNEKNALAGRSLGLSCQTAFEVPEPRQHSTRVLTAQLAMDSLASNCLEFKPFKPGQALQASSTHGYSLVDDGTAWALWQGLTESGRSLSCCRSWHAIVVSSYRTCSCLVRESHSPSLWIPHPRRTAEQSCQAPETHQLASNYKPQWITLRASDACQQHGRAAEECGKLPAPWRNRVRTWGKRRRLTNANLRLNIALTSALSQIVVGDE